MVSEIMKLLAQADGEVGFCERILSYGTGA